MLAIRVILRLPDRPLELVNLPPVGSRPFAPLATVYRSKFAPLFRKFLMCDNFRDKFFLRHLWDFARFHFLLILLVRPVIPNMHALLRQRADVRLASQEPQQFVDDAL